MQPNAFRMVMAKHRLLSWQSSMLMGSAAKRAGACQEVSPGRRAFGPFQEPFFISAHINGSVSGWAGSRSKLEERRPINSLKKAVSWLLRDAANRQNDIIRQGTVLVLLVLLPVCRSFWGTAGVKLQGRPLHVPHCPRPMMQNAQRASKGPNMQGLVFSKA